MSTGEKFTVGLVQMTLVPDPDQNLRRAIQLAEGAAKDGARIVCLPELFRSQYFCQREDAASFDLAEAVPGPSTAALAPVARDRRITLIVPVFERRAPGLYHNTAAVIGPDGKLARALSEDAHPRRPGLLRKVLLHPGDLGFRAFDTDVGRIGTLICWDQWYPEAAGSPLCAGPASSSIPPPLAGIRGKKPSLAPLSATPG